MPRRPTRTLADLSPARHHLIALIRDLGFGQLRDLRIVAGDPIVDPAPRRFRVRQLSVTDRASPIPPIIDHLPLSLQMLFDECDARGTGVIEVIKVHNGLPVFLQVAWERPPAA